MARLTKVRTGHKRGCPDKPNPTSSPLTPFFCVVNSRATAVAVRSWCSDAWWTSSLMLLCKMWTSCRRKGAESGFVEAAYSPGRRRKKKPRRSMSAVAMLSGEPRSRQ